MSRHCSAPFSRRQFMQALAVGMAAPMVLSACRVLPGIPTPEQLDTTLPLALDDDTPLATRQLFHVSVASGDPCPDGVVIWTRLNPDYLVAGEPVYFQVAEDADFTALVVDGFVAADDIHAARDYTLAIDLAGQLQSARQYFYRFVHAGISSRSGRCRTTQAHASEQAKLNLAVLTCQDYTNGYYGALNHLAADDSIDFVLHLGDFIYESVGDPSFQSLPFADRRITLPSGQTVAMGLADYRHLYQTYRSDRNLQLAMERFTWVLVPDDHETCNDCYWDYARDTLGAPDHPLGKGPDGGDPARLRQLKRESQQAWLEWVPARVSVNEAASHPHDYLRLYRRFSFGNLVDLHMLDTRSYRSAHPCGEGEVGERYIAKSGACVNLDSVGQTLLGAEQRQWLEDGLRHGGGCWQVLGNQTYMGKLAVTNRQGDGVYVNVDAWDGYRQERDALMSLVRDNGIDNLVVLTGDLHTNIASHLQLDYDDIFADPVSNRVGVEFMTPSLTSAGLVQMLVQIVPVLEKVDVIGQLSENVIKRGNPHIEFFNTSQHGYSTICFTKTYCEWTAYAVNKDSNATANALWRIARYRKAIGNHQLQAV